MMNCAFRREFENIFYTRCDECGREIQVHPTNWAPNGKRICIPCQKRRISGGEQTKIVREGVVGFTGTRKGLSTAQKASLLNVLKFLRPRVVHHGGAEGADTEFHKMVLSLGVKIVIHPSTLAEYEWENDDKVSVQESLPPLLRNRQMVDAVDVLIACPFQDYEVLRSGTCATIRYARKRRKIIIFVTRAGRVVYGMQGVDNNGKD